MLGVMIWDEDKKRAKSVADIINEHQIMWRKLTVTNNLPSENQILQNELFFLVFNKNTPDKICVAQNIRTTNETSFIILLVGQDTDLISFFRPSIRPSGVLYLPPNKILLESMLDEILTEYFRLLKKSHRVTFMIQTKSEYYSVDVTDIYFFEAQSKKIVLKTLGQEISFYSSLESILERLPDYFVRCHKGFIVNTRQIISMNLSNMDIRLRDKCTIPFSRSYKDSLRKALQQ